MNKELYGAGGTGGALTRRFRFGRNGNFYTR